MSLVTIGAASHPGLVKAENQDYYSYFLPENSQARSKGILLALADGMGGHSEGALAAKTAVETLLEAFYGSPNGNPAKALEAAFIEANAAVHAQSKAMDVTMGMGTTLTAVVLRNDRMYYAHVGDSRGYTIGADRITQFTRDHSLVAGLVRSGVISREEAQSHPDKNVITRAVGMEPYIEVDVSPNGQILDRDDAVLLCCDGLHTVVPDAEMLAVVQQNQAPEAACQALVERANANGGPDNITVVLAKVKKVGFWARWTRRFRRHARA